MDGPALRRQHRGRGVRLPAGGLLPAARVRHDHRHLRGRGASTWRWGWRSLALAGRTPARASERAAAAAAEPGAKAYWPVYAAIALSGARALGAEVIWTRLLGLMLGGHGLHVFDHPGGISGRASGSAARVGSLLAAASAKPRLALRLLPAALVGAIAWTAFMLARFAALLAGQPAALHQPLVHFPDRPGALPVGHPAGRAAVGRELSAGAGGRGARRRGLGATGGRHLRGQYRRRDPGRARLQPGPDAVDRHAGLRAGADRAGGGRARC